MLTPSEVEASAAALEGALRERRPVPGLGPHTLSMADAYAVQEQWIPIDTHMVTPEGIRPDCRRRARPRSGWLSGVPQGGADRRNREPPSLARAYGSRIALPRKASGMTVRGYVVIAHRHMITVKKSPV